MVKSKKERRSESKALAIKHPNSRKAARLAKQVVKESARNKSKLSHCIKRNITGEKLLWFQKNLEPNVHVYTPELFIELIEKYISRNDEELEQIELKHSIGQRKNRQHASREDAIRATKERDVDDWSGAGIEMVDILVPKILEIFKSWNGNLGKLDLLKIGKFTKAYLEQYKPLPAPKHLIELQTRSRRTSLCEEAMEDDIENIELVEESEVVSKQ